MRASMKKGLVSAVCCLPLVALLIGPSAAGAEQKRQQVNRAPKAADAPVKIDAEEVTVEMSLARGFNPPAIEIKTGTTVTWHNIEPIDYPVVSGFHQVVADDGSFESPKVAPGARWSFTFNEPGTFAYHCGVHPNMRGEITVTGAPVKEEPKDVRIEIIEPDPNDQQSWTFKPAKVKIEVGTKVTWVNNGSQEHTATDDDKAFDSGTLAPGEKFSFVFKEAGIYNYKCTPHPWMEGTITVHEPGKPPPKEEPKEDDEGSSSDRPSARPSSSSEGGSGPTTHYVNIVEGSSTDDWGYDPPILNVATGDTVVWENTGDIEHTVTADDGSFDSGSIPPGGTFEFTFEETGDFNYHCEPHPFMVASVNVSDSPAPNAAPGSGTRQATGPALDTAAHESDTSEEPVAAEEAAEEDVVALGPVATLSGKEVSLGIVALVLSVAVAFLLGQWWGLRVRMTSSAAGT